MVLTVLTYVLPPPIQRCFFHESDPYNGTPVNHWADRIVVGCGGGTLHVVECGIPNGLNMDLDTVKIVPAPGTRQRGDAGVQVRNLPCSVDEGVNPPCIVSVCDAGVQVRSVNPPYNVCVCIVYVGQNRSTDPVVCMCSADQKRTDPVVCMCVLW